MGLKFNGREMTSTMCPECNGAGNLYVRVTTPTAIRQARGRRVKCWRCGGSGRVARPKEARP